MPSKVKSVLLDANLSLPGKEAFPTFKNPSNDTSVVKEADVPLIAPVPKLPPMVALLATTKALPAPFTVTPPENTALPVFVNPNGLTIPPVPIVTVPILALFVTVKAVPAAVAVKVVAVNAPEETTPKVEVPVTPNVPPIVALLVTANPVPVAARDVKVVAVMAFVVRSPVILQVPKMN